MTRRRSEALGLTVVFVALTVWWLWPLPVVCWAHSAHFAGTLPESIADYYLIVWVWAWDAHALVTRPWALFHANSFYPSTLSLAYSEHFLGYMPLFAPTYWLTGNPLFAANVVVFLTYPLCALAAWAFARRYVEGPAAAVAGFFFAFSLWRYLVPPHIHVLGVQWVPIVLLMTERWLERARRRDAMCLAAALTVQVLSSVYLAYGLAIVYAPYLALALWRWRRRLDRRRLVGLAGAAGVAVALMGLTMLPYLRVRDLGLIQSYGEGNVPLGLAPYFSTRPVLEYLQHRGPGWVGYGLAVVALLPPWRRGRRWPLVIGLAVAVVATVAAFGPSPFLNGRTYWSPYALLLAWVPGFSSIRLPNRFVAIAQEGFALLAGLGVARLLDRRPAWVAWPAAAAIVLATLVSFGPYAPLPIHQEPAGAKVPGAYRWLGVHGEGRVLFEVPTGDFAVQSRRQYLSSYHWLPIVDGYSGYWPGTSAYLHWVARGLPAAASLQDLVDWVDVGWILVHLDGLPAFARAQWAQPLPPGLARVGVWGDDVLLRVTLPPRDDRRARLLSTTETLEGIPLAPVGDACPGAIRVVVPPQTPWPVWTDARITVEVENQGTTTWPATGFYPRHLLRVRGALLDSAGAELTAQVQKLSNDVAPGGTARTAFMFKAPVQPGTYTIALELIQIGDGSLARCGVPVLRVPVPIGS